MKDVELTLRLRNNRLKERRSNLGLSTKQAARMIGIGYAAYVQLEGMDPRTSPVYRSDHAGHAQGEWTDTVKKVARFFEVDPAELFPPSVFLVEANKVEKKLDLEEMQALSGACDRMLAEGPPLNPEEALLKKEEHALYRQALDSLGDRLKTVLVRRVAEGKTLAESDPNGCSRERARGLELEAQQRFRSFVYYEQRRIEIEDRARLAAKRAGKPYSREWGLEFVQEAKRREEQDAAERASAEEEQRKAYQQAEERKAEARASRLAQLRAGQKAVLRELEVAKRVDRQARTLSQRLLDRELSRSSTVADKAAKPPVFLTVKQLQQVLNLSMAAAYRFARDLGAIKLGVRVLRVPVHSIRSKLGDKTTDEMLAALE